LPWRKSSATYRADGRLSALKRARKQGIRLEDGSVLPGCHTFRSGAANRASTAFSWHWARSVIAYYAAQKVWFWPSKLVKIWRKSGQ
jgi:hypothetical protein